MKKRLARLLVTAGVVTAVLFGGAGSAEANDSICAKFGSSRLSSPTVCLPLL